MKIEEFAYYVTHILQLKKVTNYSDRSLVTKLIFISSLSDMRLKSASIQFYFSKHCRFYPVSSDRTVDQLEMVFSGPLARTVWNRINLV